MSYLGRPAGTSSKAKCRISVILAGEMQDGICDPYSTARLGCALIQILIEPSFVCGEHEEEEEEEEYPAPSPSQKHKTITRKKADN